MTARVTVGWAPWMPSHVVDDAQHTWCDAAFFEPEPVLPLLQSTGQPHTRCPAFTDYYSNTFVIRSPLDLNLRIEQGVISTDRHGADFYHRFIQNRSVEIHGQWLNQLTLRTEYLFVADTDVVIEQQPVSQISSDLLSNTLLVPGTFNIHRWPRPIEFAVSVIDPSKTLSLRRGDPLFFVKFNAAKHKKVLLKRIEISDRLRKTVQSLVLSRNIVPNKNLSYRYEMAKNFLFGKKWLD